MTNHQALKEINIRLHIWTFQNIKNPASALRLTLAISGVCDPRGLLAGCFLVRWSPSLLSCPLRFVSCVRCASRCLSVPPCVRREQWSVRGWWHRALSFDGDSTLSSAQGESPCCAVQIESCTRAPLWSERGGTDEWRQERTRRAKRNQTNALAAITVDATEIRSRHALLLRRSDAKRCDRVATLLVGRESAIAIATDIAAHPLASSQPIHRRRRGRSSSFFCVAPRSGRNHRCSGAVG